MYERVFFTDSLSSIATTCLLLFFFVRSFVRYECTFSIHLSCLSSQQISPSNHTTQSLETTKKNTLLFFFVTPSRQRKKKALSFTDNRQEKKIRERKIEKGSSGTIKRDIFLTFHLHCFLSYFTLTNYGQQKLNSLWQFQ